MPASGKRGRDIAMTRLFSHRDRAVHLGPFPMERLQRVAEAPTLRARAREGLAIAQPDRPESLANAMIEYVDVMDRMREGPVAPNKAPVPRGSAERANHMKAACYYLDASMAATGRIPENVLLETPIANPRVAASADKEYAAGSADNPIAQISVREGREAWSREMKEDGEFLSHTHALVILVEYTRDPDPSEPGGSGLLHALHSDAAGKSFPPAGKTERGRPPCPDDRAHGMSGPRFPR